MHFGNINGNKEITNMREIAHEPTEGYDWLVESVIRKDGTGIAVTTGTNSDGEQVFFVSEFEDSGLDPTDREYAIIRVEEELRSAIQLARNCAKGEKIESNVTSHD
jgi:hypothetical protein